jgi:hypothetical protein
LYLAGGTQFFTRAHEFPMPGPRSAAASTPSLHKITRVAVNIIVLWRDEEQRKKEEEAK